MLYLFYPSTHLPRNLSAKGGPIHFFMQNKPNLTNEGNKLKAPPKAAQLNNQSSIITNQLKGEPNFTPNATTKHANRANFNPISHSILQLFTQLRSTTPQKLQKIPAFCNFLTLTHLTPCTTKTYINITPQNTGHGPRGKSHE